MSVKPKFHNVLRPWPYVASIAIFAAYCVWISGPYLHSVIVRDAAVTSWSNVTTAPISGTIEFKALRLNEPVGDEGVIATIHNEHMSTEAVDNAALKVELVGARVIETRQLLDQIKQFEEERRETKAQYASLFRAQLDTDIAHSQSNIALNEDRLNTIRSISQHTAQLAAKGAGTVRTADEVLLRVAEVELDLEEFRAELHRARIRRSAADQGIFMDADGQDPDWALDVRVRFKIAKMQARFQLRNAEAELKSAELELAKVKADWNRQSAAPVAAPPGRILWRRAAASGMTVRAGDPVAEWVDCDQLLVDMPVSDAEASLIVPGEPATVVLEGSSEAINGEVILVRGAASTLGRAELAALAKGRQPEQAQVLIRLAATATDFESCPVGRAAYVDFPGIGIVDVVLARLRLRS